MKSEDDQVNSLVEITSKMKNYKVTIVKEPTTKCIQKYLQSEKNM